MVGALADAAERTGGRRRRRSVMAGPTAAAGLARGFDGGVVADLGWTRRAGGRLA